MPICVLLIDNNACHAQVVVSALADPWLGWQVDVATSVEAGLQRVRQGGVDIVICRHQLQDGTAFDVLEVLQGIPALVLVRPGLEGHAAHAMRHGFADFAVQDPDSNYLLALPAQIEAVLERSTSARARRSAEAMLTRQHRLLQAISRAQAVFIASAKPEAAFDALLDELMELTRSSFGMVGHVQHTPGGSATLHLHAMTDIHRDEATRMQTVRRLQEARVFDSTTPLVGQVLAHEEPLILEDASADASCQPLPAGLPLVGPHEPLPLRTWEYTDEPGLHHVYALGQRDGEIFLRTRAVRFS